MDTIKTVVFDLDGTIYQNNHFHGDYIRFLLAGSGRESWHGALVDFIEQVYRGEKMTMNAYYRTDKITADTPECYISALEGQRAEDLPFRQARDRKDLLFLGDAWALVTLMGLTLGLLEGDRGNVVYKQTRDKMSADGMHGDPNLRRAIERLGEKYETVLLTNSYEQTALDFLAQLGYSGMFKRAVYSAQKPYGLVENLSRHIPELAQRPQTFLTIGDHAFNDLMPLQELGCKALWINPFENIHEARADYTVKTLPELADFLDRM